MTSFSKWVRATRRAKDLTLGVVSERAGIKQPVWSKWETGTQTPRRETVIKIAEALEEPVDYALTMAGYVPTQDDAQYDLSELGAVVRQIAPERREKAVEAMRKIAETFLMFAA